MTAALLLATAAGLQSGDGISTSNVVGALMNQDWPRVEEYKRRLGSFKHPIAPQDAKSRAGDILSSLQQYGSSAQPYGRALVAMRIALENGADPNEGGGMPLMYMAGVDRWGKLVERLLKAGANPNKPKELLPLRTAVEGRRVASVGHLLSAGANPNILTEVSIFRRPKPGFPTPQG